MDSINKQSGKQLQGRTVSHTGQILCLKYRKNKIVDQIERPVFGQENKMSNIQCHICRDQFSNREQLTLHLNSHHNEGNTKLIKKTPECLQSLVTKADLKIHTSIHQMYECKMCDKQLSSDIKCIEHMISHFLKGIFDCETCEKMFIDMRSHIVTHLHGESYRCGICEKKFDENSSLDVHMKSVHSFKCEMCHEVLDDRDLLQQHMNAHASSKPIPCDLCSKKFISNDYLTLHKKTIHIDQNKNVEEPMMSDVVNSNIKPMNSSKNVHESYLTINHPDKVLLRPQKIVIKRRLNENFTSNDCVARQHESIINQTNNNNITVKSQNFTKLNEKRRESNAIGVRHQSDKEVLRPQKVVMKRIIVNERKISNDPALIVRNNGEIHTDQKNNNVHPNSQNVSALHCNKAIPSPAQVVAVTENIFLRNNFHCKCAICWKRFSRKDEFIEHIKTHNGEIINEQTIMSEYTCCLCGKVLITRVSYLGHVSKHSSKKPYECDTCKKTYAYKDSLRQHILSNHVKSTDGKTYECKKCHCKFTNHIRYKKHLSSWHNTRQHNTITQYDEDTKQSGNYLNYKFECNICSGCFKDKKSLMEHTETHSGELPIKCEICNEGFVCSKKIAAHLTTHLNDDRPFKCETCNETFILKVYLELHIKKFHNKFSTNRPSETSYIDKGFQCVLCNRKFNKNTVYVKHVTSHTRHKHYVCEICGKSYIGPSEFTYHMNGHNGIRPFKCEICSKDFSVRTRYNAHMRTHTGDRPYKCEICPEEKRFRMLFDWKKHMWQHEGYVPFKCEPCGKKYFTRYKFKEHLMTHITEKPFVCDLCEKAYRQRKNLQNHKKIVHCVTKGKS